MYLGIRTDSPEATFYLYEGAKRVEQKTWQADRELAKKLLGELEVFLGEHDQQFTTLKGLFIYKGPGSFTGLRIGTTVMNTLAYGLSIPIVGEKGDDWINNAVLKLNDGKNDTLVLPFYGADPRITKPTK